MCGICGVWNYATGQAVDRDVLRRMRDTMTHRGPDDSGEYFDDDAGVGLGFRRLAIIDLSPAAHQPMPNEDGTVWLVFNGEIYNFLELRRRLEAKGHVFRSKSDGEAIVHQYEDHDAAGVEDLNGMFALALWDSSRQRMVLARDRVGKKPLYYRLDGGKFAFASELKALLQEPSLSRELDWSALGAYLALGYVPPPRTIFCGIRKLEPGHVMVVEKERTKSWRYWDWLPAFHERRGERSEEEWSEELLALLRTVVRDRLISDVPLGAFLSGGMDSSAVVAMMATLSDQPIKTFSIGFKDERYSELDYARMVAQRFGTEHHEYIVEPEQLSELLSRLSVQFDEPLADSSILPTYYVSKIARADVTVCLSGDGGDEALAGYSRYQQTVEEQRADRFPLVLRRALFGPPAALLPLGVRGQQFAHRMTLPGDRRYVSLIRTLPERQIRSVLSREAAERLQEDGSAYVSEALERAARLDSVSQLQYVDAMTYLPEDILVKVDRTSMLNSLEVRCPLLDHRFLEFMAGVPAALRLRNGQGKYIFKRALQRLVPDAVLDRAKMGFGIPLREWTRDDTAEYAASVLLDARTTRRGIWRQAVLERILAEHRTGARRLEGTIWTLLVLELWFRAYLDGFRA